MTRFGKSLQSERGAVLITGLVVLLVLTLLGLATMQATTLQQKMAGNMGSQSQAFQAAEAALREGENFLRTTALLPAFDGSAALYPAGEATSPLWQKSSTWSAGSSKVFSDELAGGGAKPRYIIEKLPYVPSAGDSLASDEVVPDEVMYRVTARGESSAGNSVVVLQSTCLQ